MTLQRMILVPPELWECRSQEHSPPVKVILKSMNKSSNKWTQFRFLENPYLKSEKQKRVHIPNLIIETGSTKPRLKQTLNENV